LGLITPRWIEKKNGVILILAMGIGGYLAYIYSAFGLPGTQNSIKQNGTPYFLLAAAVGMIVGFGAGLIYTRFISRRK